LCIAAAVLRGTYAVCCLIDICLSFKDVSFILDAAPD